ncbi:hypothetical protein SFRURICE_016839, partial [Spodoptera frugiperda]
NKNFGIPASRNAPAAPIGRVRIVLFYTQRSVTPFIPEGPIAIAIYTGHNSRLRATTETPCPAVALATTLPMPMMRQLRATTEKFSKNRKEPSNTLPDPGIEPETSRPSRTCNHSTNEAVDTSLGPNRTDARSGAADNVTGYRGSGSKQEKERSGF